VQTGQSGMISEFVDLTDEGLGQEVAFSRRRHHAELVQVMVLARLPSTGRKGMLIVHSPHGAGIKTRFWGEFAAWFKARHPDHVVSIERTVPGGAASELVRQGELRKVTLVKHVRPSDVTDEERMYFDEALLGTVRTVIAAPRMGPLKKTAIAKVLAGESRISSLLTFKGEEYNEVSVEVQSKNRKHTIHVGEQRVPRGGEDVTGLLQYDDDGVPTEASLRQAALEYIDLLFE
jgi:hypothetical protein